MPRKKFQNENWTYHKINKLASSGDKSDLKALKTYNRKLARLANKQLRELKKAGKDYYAYDSAQSFTLRAYNTTRYKDNLSDPKSIKLQILSMQRFLNYETSTVAGHLAVEARRRDKFRTMYPDMVNVSDNELDDFLRFLGNAPLHSTIYEEGKVMSGQIVDLIRGQYFNSDTEKRQEILNMFERYRQTRESQQIGRAWTDYDLGYDELMQYLRTGEDPTGYYSKESDKD